MNHPVVDRLCKLHNAPKDIGNLICNLLYLSIWLEKVRKLNRQYVHMWLPEGQFRFIDGEFVMNARSMDDILENWVYNINTFELITWRHLTFRHYVPVAPLPKKYCYSL